MYEWNTFKIGEAFFGCLFLNVHDTSGESLLKSLLEMADGLGINILDMRGQADDHSTNRNGKNKGSTITHNLTESAWFVCTMWLSCLEHCDCSCRKDIKLCLFLYQKKI